MTASLACVGGVLALGFVSAFVPLVSIELTLVAAAATTRSDGLVFVLVVAAAIGQMLGKSCIFLGGRGVSLRAKPHTPDRRVRGERLGRLLARAGRRRAAAASTVLVSAFSGLPPFALVSALAGAWRIRLAQFFALGFAGRSARFAGVLVVPHLMSVAGL